MSARVPPRTDGVLTVPPDPLAIARKTVSRPRKISIRGLRNSLLGRGRGEREQIIEETKGKGVWRVGRVGKRHTLFGPSSSTDLAPPHDVVRQHNIEQVFCGLADCCPKIKSTYYPVRKIVSSKGQNYKKKYYDHQDINTASLT